MDPHSSPYIIPNNSPQYPFPHSLQSWLREAHGLQALKVEAYALTRRAEVSGT